MEGVPGWGLGYLGPGWASVGSTWDRRQRWNSIRPLNFGRRHHLTSLNCQTIDISMPPSRSWQMANMFGRTGFQESSMNCLLMTDDDGSHASLAIFCQHNKLGPSFSDLWRPTTRTMRSSDSPREFSEKPKLYKTLYAMWHLQWGKHPDLQFDSGSNFTNVQNQQSILLGMRSLMVQRHLFHVCFHNIQHTSIMSFRGPTWIFASFTWALSVCDYDE